MGGVLKGAKVVSHLNITPVENLDGKIAVQFLISVPFDYKESNIFVIDCENPRVLKFEFADYVLEETIRGLIGESAEKLITFCQSRQPYQPETVPLMNERPFEK